MASKNPKITITQQHAKNTMNGAPTIPESKLRYLDNGKVTELELTPKGYRRKGAKDKGKSYSRPNATFHNVTIQKTTKNGTLSRQASRITMHFKTAEEKKQKARRSKTERSFSTDAMVLRIVDKQPEPGTYERTPEGFHEGIYFMNDGQILITKPPAGVEVRVEFVQNDGGGLTDYRC